jgi:hypothetical protein
MQDTTESVPARFRLPLTPFRIQDNSGRCADREPDGDVPTWMLVDPSCDPLNLNEQLTYDPVTNQVVTLGTGYCLDINRLTITTWQPCDSTNPGQRFWSTAPDSFGRSRIFTIVGSSKLYLQSPPITSRCLPPPAQPSRPKNSCSGSRWCNRIIGR